MFIAVRARARRKSEHRERERVYVCVCVFATDRVKWLQKKKKEFYGETTTKASVSEAKESLWPALWFFFPVRFLKSDDDRSFLSDQSISRASNLGFNRKEEI